MKRKLSFPEKFLWGVAVSSHQVEGNNFNNQWWAWEQMPGNIWHGDKSGIACNWWENAEEDFDRAQQMGMNALRLSLEWSRIEPHEGQFDSSALERYREMLEGLRHRGIEPMVTLHHFTNPLWLEVKGGWENPKVVDYFRRYVRYAVDSLGDLANKWCTVNEPVIYAMQSYLSGLFPPGKHSFARAFRVLNHMLKAHGHAYKTIHYLQSDAEVGIAKNIRPLVPENPHNPMDVRMARFLSYLFNDLGLLPARDGWLRPPLSFRVAPYYPLVDTLDFVGVNYYSPTVVKFNPLKFGQLFMEWGPPKDVELSDSGRYGPYGGVVPAGLYWSIKFASKLGKPIYITENGVPDDDDDLRPRFILTHLAQMHKAISEGYDVRGYYHWSLIDNFEWSEGWGLRFGLIELDVETQERRLRRSGKMYGEIARENGITEDIVEAYVPEVMEEVFGS